MLSPQVTAMRPRFSSPALCLVLLAASATAAAADDDVRRRLAIVAPEQFHEDLAGYVEFRGADLPTSLYSLETILRDTDGVDDPERLKRFLFDRWRDDHLGYVLLVGDADVMPVRYMCLDRITPAAFDYAFYPSDLYYSDLARSDGSFDDWNAQRDGFHAHYFGEVRGEKNKDDPINFDGIDYIPDVAVGRWPVSSRRQLRTVIEKTIAYENALASGEKPGANTLGLFAVSGWVDSRPMMDFVAGKAERDWTVRPYYYSDRRRPVGEPPVPAPTMAELQNLLNEGAGVVLHAGHGTDTTWEQCLPADLPERLDNRDRLPILISAGCSTARLATLPPYEAYRDVHGVDHAGSDHGEVFTEPPPPPSPYQTGRHNTTGLGETLLRESPHGAVAYIGCNTGSQPCGLTLLAGFAEGLDTLPAEQQRLGDCWAHAVAYYHKHERLADLKPDDGWYPPSIFFQGMKFMLYGDPTLRLPAFEAITTAAGSTP